jgi:hypothetical protein
VTIPPIRPVSVWAKAIPDTMNATRKQLMTPMAMLFVNFM